MSSYNMIRWSGLSLCIAGVLMALGTAIHPSHETMETILLWEGRLIAAHWMLMFYAAFFMLGITGVLAAYARELSRTGLVGFLLLFFGTLFYAVSSDYGFTAPVLARLAPQTLDAINAYLPVRVMDGLMVLFMFPGFILFGVAILRSCVLPAWSGILIAVGWPIFIIAAAFSMVLSQRFWLVAVFGSALAGAGLIWIGVLIWIKAPKKAYLPASS